MRSVVQHVDPLRVRIVGRGRAGGSLNLALSESPSVTVVESIAHNADLGPAAGDVDLVVLAVPDHAIASVAQRIVPCDSAVVIHLSGASGLDRLTPHSRRGSLHPLVSMSDPESGAKVLRGAWMAVSGDPLVHALAEALDGREFQVEESDRALYHATAAIAANHLVGLLGQVERLSLQLGVPVEAFLDLAGTAFASTRHLGAAAALTGPVARGDWETVRSHLAALPSSEVALYRANLALVARLANRVVPDDLVG